MILDFTKKIIIAVCSFISLTAFSQTTIISSTATTNPNGSFENATSTFAANGWTAVNAGTNTWVIGTTAFNSGSKGAYISNNGTNNNYTKNTSQVSHFYRDVTFPAGQSCITLSFNWKGDGESSFDFLKVYLTNTTTAVTAGTQQSSADQLGVEYSGQTSWQSVSLVVPASYAGTTKRLVFSWVNDNSNGTNPAAAVDNISLVSSTPSTPSCATYSLPANGASLCPTAQTLSWSALAAPSCGSISYDVYFNAGTTATSLVSSSQTGTTYVTGALTANTTYAWKIVPRNGSLLATGCSTFTFSTNSFVSSSTAPISDNFESCLDWTIVNGTQPNIWTLGSATNNGGTQSMYVTNNGGTSNAYTNSSSSVVHFYKDITFPAGQTCITLSFDWKSVGEVGFDFLKVYLTNTTTAVTAGTQQSAADQLGIEYSNQSTWQTITLSIPAANAGTTKRLVFSWRNDGSAGTNPPAAIDNINITSSNAPVPSCAAYNFPSNGSATCPSSQILSWTAITAPTCGSIAYDVYFNSGTTATTLVSGAQTGTTYTTGILSPGTTYSWKIVPKNGTITATGCSTYSFTTGSITSSSVAPFTNNFETCSDWTLVNGTQANIWTQGTATNNGGSQSMYISNDGGATNSYDNTSTTVVHFYKDISFPAGQSCILLNFDWKSDGQNTQDYLRVFAVPTTTTPVAGTQLTSGQVGITYSLQTTWQNVSVQLPASYAGTTQRIVFSWRNNGSNGNNPPAAVDNISISTSIPPVPNCVSGAISPTDGYNSLCAGTTSLNLTWTAPTVVGCNATTGYNLFFGTNNPPTNIINGTAVGNVTSYSVSGLSAGNTYYWQVVPTNSAGSASGCSTYTFSFASSPANDLPCNAVNVPLGTIASGDNSCAGNTGEPATPSCWTTGTANTVWFSFVAPSTGNVKIRTAPGTLLNTQIAVYSGTCGAGMTMLTSACNNDAPSCGGTAVLLSELSLTGLTSGATYYIAVDGENSLTGTFALTVIESSTSYPSTSGQTCSNSILACNSAISIGNPGFQGIGFTCDDDGSNNCTGGERGSVWYTINIQSAGSLNFSIIPNDYDPTSVGAETDYDFVLWKISGSGATSCSSIGSSGGNNVTACNYDGYGVTGVAPGGNAPSPYSSSYNFAFEPTVTVAAGEVYVLLIENYSNSTAGFSLDLTSTSAGVINYAPPTTVTWSGGANTNTWTSVVNWGGCTAPACGIDAIISTASSFQPLISSAMGTVTVNNLTIDPGAILTLGPNSVLSICGNLTNNGSIVADPTSIITFTDNATHTLNGTLSGSSTLGNLIITDAAGGSNCTVVANTNIELKGNFTTSNTTSIFNLNGNNLLIAGNFNNAAGASTFSNTAGSTITFKGSSAQIYNPNANAATPSLTLNNVVLNNSSTGVTLSTTNTPNLILGPSGVLTLTAGKIITPNSQEVTVMNTANAAVSAGNTTSYVQGNLRRYLAAGATGVYDFPVGHATPGYERASLDFKTGAAAGAINLLARFDPWGGAWPLPPAPNWAECSTVYNAPYLNNGYWSIDASSPSTGLYDLTLYNGGYTTSSAGWSIAKSPSSAPAWALNGNCVSSPVTAVVRQGMSGFSKMATVQGSLPLPVELISFSGSYETTHNSIYWKTAAEERFKQYELESSSDGISFTKIATITPLGNVSTYNNYNYLDFKAYTPTTYYRLKMVDLDNSYKYSQIISVENISNTIESFIVYPNPASKELFIKLSIPGEKEAFVDIKDLFGRSVYQQRIDLTQNSNNIYINTSEFSSGIYVINLSSGSLSENTKIVISNNH
ncbi:MAG: T9SS type A sorting domain-containing protein [Bacteroidetes bacterium]|nr:T9SS type A sorting domain-containing protein [Bacteroidota bacterium]